MKVMKKLLEDILYVFQKEHSPKSSIGGYSTSIINIESELEYTILIDEKHGFGMKNIIKIEVDCIENIINMTGYIDDDKKLNDCIEALEAIYSNYNITGSKCIPVVIKPKTKKVRVKQYIEYDVEIPVNTDKIEINCYCCGEECDLIKDTIIEYEEEK